MRLFLNAVEKAITSSRTLRCSVFSAAARHHAQRASYIDTLRCTRVTEKAYRHKGPAIRQRSRPQFDFELYSLKQTLIWSSIAMRMRVVSLWRGVFLHRNAMNKRR